MLEFNGTVPEAASQCRSQAPQIGGGVISKNKNKVALKRPKDFSSVYIPKRVHKKQKGTPVDVDAICARIREAQEKRALLQAKQELEGDVDKAVATSTGKKNETTKRKIKRNKRSKMKIPFNF